MPVYYIDTSALVKRYSRERGTKTVNTLLAKRGRLAILGSVAIPEFYAALALKARQGELTRDDWYSVLFKFESEADRGLYQFITPSSRTFLTTKQLILEYPFLRSTQAIHLALAQELRPLRLSFVSSDQQILELCRSFGMVPINPEDD